MLKSVKAKVTKGHGVASGNSPDCPYANGSIAMQRPYFNKQGLDLSDLHNATLNLSISPKSFELADPEFTFHQIKWTKEFPAEDFSFSPCAILFQGVRYHGYIYYPHPETKINHNHNSSVIEVMLPLICDIAYADEVLLLYDDEQLRIL